MKVGVIGIPGAWSTEAFVKAFWALGVEAEVVDPATCSLSLAEGEVLRAGEPLRGFDAFAVKKLGEVTAPATRSRIQILRWLADRAPVLSASEAIEKAMDRYRMSLELARAGLPVPETLVTEQVEEAQDFVATQRKVVCKPLYTSKGRGMALLEAGGEVRQTLQALAAAGQTPLYLQRFIPNRGRDVGIAVLGGRYLGAYSRVQPGEHWLTTTAAGGRYEPFDPPVEFIDAAVRAVEVFGLEFSTVDLVETDNGPLLYEVSAFGGFRGLHEGCGIDAAARVAEHLLDRFRQEGSRGNRAGIRDRRVEGGDW